MQDEYKTKARLIEELNEMRNRIAELESGKGLQELPESLQEALNLLQTAEAKYRGIFENAIVGIFHTSPEGSFLDANPAVARMFGYDSPEELMNRVTHVGTQLYVDPEARKKWISIIDKQDYAAFETEMQKKDGSTCWVRQSARAVRNAEGETIYYEGFSEDITERKRYEEELEKYRNHLEELVKERTEQLIESENKYRTIFENTGNATLIFGEDTKILLVNSEFEHLFHYTREEAEGKKSWTDLVLPEELERLMEYHRLRGTDPGAAPRNYELKVINRSGRIRDAHMTLAMIPGTNKRVASLLDITPHKRVERALRESEALYRNLFENASIGMFQTSLEGRFLRINKSYAEMLGYDSPEEVMETITDTATQIHADPGNRAVLLATLAQNDWFYGEQPYLRKDGSIMIGKLAVRRVLNPDGTIAYLEGIVEDITERKWAEEALVESERELRIQAQDLMEVNTTMRVLLGTMEKDQEELTERFLENIKAQVLPYLDKLKKMPLQEVEKGLVQMAELHLNEIASPFVHKLTSSYLNLTKKEIQIAALVREGKTSKEIAELLNSKKRVIEFHRENIRQKLGLKNKKESLAILLRSFT